MKNLITTFLLILSATALHAAELTKYEVKVGEFSELKVTDGINVDYRCSADSAGMAVFSAPSRLVSALLLNSSGKKLTIQLTPEHVGTPGLPRVTVYSRYLTKVTNTGDSTVRVLDVAGCPDFEATVEGNGSLVIRDIKATNLKGTLKLGHGSLIINGECTKGKLTSIGTGIIEADGLKAEDLSVKVSGTGSVGVWATKKLSVFGMGSTTIYYKGKPEIKNRSLGIKVVPLK
ncbi:MAG: DUF2807 domain-containing protein [Muribaculaceae bacterium]|nr:DUF2807 domain-containing protein [Muribaculaceae bacterium]